MTTQASQERSRVRKHRVIRAQAKAGTHPSLPQAPSPGRWRDSLTKDALGDDVSASHWWEAARPFLGTLLSGSHW